MYFIFGPEKLKGAVCMASYGVLQLSGVIRGGEDPDALFSSG